MGALYGNKNKPKAKGTERPTLRTMFDGSMFVFGIVRLTLVLNLLKMNVSWMAASHAAGICPPRSLHNQKDANPLLITNYCCPCHHDGSRHENSKTKIRIASNQNCEQKQHNKTRVVKNNTEASPSMHSASASGKLGYLFMCVVYANSLIFRTYVPVKGTNLLPRKDRTLLLRQTFCQFTTSCAKKGTTSRHGDLLESLAQYLPRRRDNFPAEKGVYNTNECITTSTLTIHKSFFEYHSNGGSQGYETVLLMKT
jgi:hypothetical protein